VSSVPFVVTVAETTIARSQLANTILLRSAVRLAILILGAAVIVWFAVTASLGPLYRMRDAIAERNPGDLHPIEQPAPNEVKGLVDSVNSFMGRLNAAIDALRHFTGNASHQLRTPLTIIRTQLALAARAGSLEEARAAAKSGDEAVAHAERVLAQLLLLAKTRPPPSG
jgi:two-component system sensor histidine kinase TctE